jgi:methionyl-tRNA formyltransferase
MKLVLFTNKGSSWGGQVWSALKDHQIEIQAVVMIQQPFRYHWRLFRSVQRRTGLYDALYFSVRRILEDMRERSRKDDRTRQSRSTVPVLCTRGTNSQETQDLLKRLCPDVLLLAQTGVVARGVLDIPRVGTLNVHPGILPDYRGIDCAKWAILNREFDKVGVSVHWVEQGVDTGPILLRRVYQFKGAESLENIGESVYSLGISMLVEVLSVLQDGAPHSGDPQKLQEGKQYYKMPRRLEKTAKIRLEEYFKEIRTTKEEAPTRRM